MTRLFTGTIVLADVRHDDKPCYRAEGVGGEPIERWPIYRFFRLYADGRPTEAAEAFEAWYRDQFDKYGLVPKARGGMYRGSLYRLIAQGEREGGSRLEDRAEQADPARIARSITERVRQRFALFDTIAAQGYVADPSENVVGIRRRGFVFLVDGHHRAAILRVLGYVSIGDARLFPSQAVYAVVRRFHG